MTIDPIFTTTAPKPTTSIITVSPEMARRWLEHNKHNRPIAKSIVARYRSDMASGNWAFTADPIRFAVSGNLLDGQHRLHALGELDNASIPLLVVRGLPEESQLFMDQGRKRSPGQQLALLGVKNSNNVAAAAKQYMLWQSSVMFKDSSKQSVSSPQIQQWVADNPELVNAMNTHLPALNTPDAPPSITQAAFIRFTEIDSDAASQFFTMLASGAGLNDGDPILALDKRLRRIRKEGLRASSRDMLALFILAWNAWRDGRSLSKFQKPKGSVWTVANFPEAK